MNGHTGALDWSAGRPLSSANNRHILTITKCFRTINMAQAANSRRRCHLLKAFNTRAIDWRCAVISVVRQDEQSTSLWWLRRWRSNNGPTHNKHILIWIEFSVWEERKGEQKSANPLWAISSSTFSLLLITCFSRNFSRDPFDHYCSFAVFSVFCLLAKRAYLRWGRRFAEQDKKKPAMKEEKERNEHGNILWISYLIYFGFSVSCAVSRFHSNL